MNWKRVVGWTFLTAGLALTPAAVRAQDPAEPGDAPPAASETKPSFWGDKNALYVEIAGGSASADDLVTSLRSSATKYTDTTLTLDGIKMGRVSVGWKLPFERGWFLATFNGFKEDGYDLVSTGRHRSVINTTGGGSSILRPDGFAPVWWTVRGTDGSLVSERTVPTWDQAVDDANGNGTPEVDEIVYSPTPAISIERGAPDDLFNRFQTIDLTYQRDFGGRTIEGRWSTGARYFVYEGNLPATAWLLPTDRAEGFTDGLALPILAFSQKSSGIGPTGSIGVQFHFFRERLTFYAEGRTAFIVQSLESDSGPFVTLVQIPELNEFRLISARLTQDDTKSVWQVGGEIGGRVRILEGLFVHVAVSRQAYQDSVLLPTDITVPDNLGAADDGTTALYSTQDIVIDTARAGLSFQF